MNPETRPGRPPQPTTPAEYLRRGAAMARSAAQNHRDQAAALAEEADGRLTEAAESDARAAAFEEAAAKLEADA